MSQSVIIRSLHVLKTAVDNKRLKETTGVVTDIKHRHTGHGDSSTHQFIFKSRKLINLGITCIFTV